MPGMVSAGMVSANAQSSPRSSHLSLPPSVLGDRSGGWDHSSHPPNWSLRSEFWGSGVEGWGRAVGRGVGWSYLLLKQPAP